MSQLTDQILALSHLRSTEIARRLGCGSSYARRVLRRHGKNHPVGPPSGEANPSWVGGRHISLDGYVYVSVQGRRTLEHRQVMEQELGRDLLDTEVVDHIDGITLHNDPNNLQLYATNGQHLAETSLGARSWSNEGRQNIGARTDLGTEIQRVDTYRRRKVRGDVRLRAILLAWLSLDKDSPYLLGTRHWLEQNRIDPDFRPSLEQAWDDLERRYALDLL